MTTIFSDKTKWSVFASVWSKTHDGECIFLVKDAHPIIARDDEERIDYKSLIVHDPKYVLVISTNKDIQDQTDLSCIYLIPIQRKTEYEYHCLKRAVALKYLDQNSSLVPRQKSNPLKSFLTDEDRKLAQIIQNKKPDTMSDEELVQHTIGILREFDKMHDVKDAETLMMTRRTCIEINQMADSEELLAPFGPKQQTVAIALLYSALRVEKFVY